jgi:sugar phosphate isomerase/epimerase
MKVRFDVPILRRGFPELGARANAIPVACLTAFLLASALPLRAAATPRDRGAGLFAKENLVAWCLVPFDARKRGPEERAAMLERLGFKLFAYDYRAEHVPTFDAEMEALQRHHIKLLAWWFPGAMDNEARLILDVLKRHGSHAQLWITGGGGPIKDAAEQAARIEAETRRIRPIADEAAKIGCTVALYNHGSWFGEPENQITIIERLKAGGVTNVGIVYNLHHGHDHLDRFPALLAKMKPYLVALNLNGMTRNGDQVGKKILPLGQGDLDLDLLRIIRDSGWRGPIGILNHTDEDAEGRLQDNLDGLNWLVAQLDGQAAGPKPVPRTWRPPGKP